MEEQIKLSDILSEHDTIQIVEIGSDRQSIAEGEKIDLFYRLDDSSYMTGVESKGPIKGRTHVNLVVVTRDEWIAALSKRYNEPDMLVTRYASYNLEYGRVLKILSRYF